MILDTNALSAIVDGDEDIQPRIRTAASMALPAVVLGEYRYGVRNSKLRASLEAWLVENLPDYDLLPIDASTAAFYAEVRDELRRLGKPLPENDLWIAALGRQHRMPILTRDRHFSVVPGIDVLAW